MLGQITVIGATAVLFVLLVAQLVLMIMSVVIKYKVVYFTLITFMLLFIAWRIWG